MNLAWLKRHARTIAASMALLLALAWVLRAGALPLLPPARALARAEPWGVVAMGLLLLASIFLRLGRCHFLLAPIAHVSIRRLMTISFVALGLLTFLPFRLGEVARPAMLREKGKVSGWAVTATVGAERIIDGIVFSVALLLGLAFAKPHEPLPDHIGDLPVPAMLVPKAAVIAALAFGGAFVAMAAFYFWRSLARRVTERVLGVFSHRFAARVADVIERLSDGLRFLPDVKNSIPFVVATILGFLSQAWGVFLLARAVGLPELSFAQATVALGVLGLGFSLPNAPGFFGSFQLALYAGLAIYVPPSAVVNEGAVLVFIFYSLYIFEVVVLTVVGLFGEYGAGRSPAGESERIGTTGSEKAM